MNVKIVYHKKIHKLSASLNTLAEVRSAISRIYKDKLQPDFKLLVQLDLSILSFIYFRRRNAHNRRRGRSIQLRQRRVQEKGLAFNKVPCLGPIWWSTQFRWHGSTQPINDKHIQLCQRKKARASSRYGAINWFPGEEWGSAIDWCPRENWGLAANRGTREVGSSTADWRPN